MLILDYVFYDLLVFDISRCVMFVIFWHNDLYYLPLVRELMLGNQRRNFIFLLKNTFSETMSPTHVVYLKDYVMFDRLF